VKQPSLIVRIFDKCVVALAVGAALTITFMMISISIGVGTRYLLNLAPTWLIEFNGYMMVFTAFFCAAWVLKEDGHVRVDLVLTHLKPKTQNILNFLTSIVGTGVCAIITWFGILTVVDHFQRHALTPTDMEIPLYLLLVVIPLGMLALTLQFVRRAAHYLDLAKTSPDEKAK